MRCPFCGAEELKVIDSRPNLENNTIRRRRECMDCSSRFTTYERIEDVSLMVVKKDANREEFNRSKIMRGIVRACEKRPVSAQQIEDVVTRIEQKLANQMKKEVSSQAIGELVMAELKQLDEVAYVRFASVYKSFRDIDTFVLELRKMLHEKKQ
ncbi:MAG TPA: transcriptional repressor NrdR [Tissierellia bacterium]|nr:transcriptional repressor NrdR [Tissierellia bacterium]